ncbi:hypothetical protein BJ741DRAFT_605251 [Chytriomyces cf. hyalinus JEL632]|nr:hypothetical protein BJ741DRAFT_605251 [Chytriomyces cf. hyalinus JEL632]
MGSLLSRPPPDNTPPAIPLGQVRGTSSTSDDQIAAAYFGESAKLFFGPHFITNSHVLQSAGAVTMQSNGSSPAASGLAQLLVAPFSFWNSNSNSASSPSAKFASSVGPNLEGKLTEDELMEISRLYNQAPLGDVNLTSTLQSLTNLRKASLKMTPIAIEDLPSTSTTPSAAAAIDSNAAKRHILEFQFDASSPCIIHVYYLSKEILVQKADGSRKLAFAPKYADKRASSRLDDAAKKAVTRIESSGGGGGSGAADLALPTVKTYGPFPAGLNQKFCVPEADAFDSKWFSKEELVFGESAQPKSAVVGAEAAGVGPESLTTNVAENAESVKEVDLEAGKIRVETPHIEANSEEVAAQEVAVDVSSLDDDVNSKANLLLSNEAMYYPLVIVMEALDDPVDDLQTFREPAEKTVNIQVTYASLLTKNNHSLAVKVLKQKALIDGTPYLLHDVFGYTDPTGTGQSNPNVSLAAEDLQTMRECVVCMSELKDTIVLPCRHLCLCHGCGETLRMQGRNANGGAMGSGVAPKCPICRQTFESLLQINLPNPYSRSDNDLREVSSVSPNQ